MDNKAVKQIINKFSGETLGNKSKRVQGATEGQLNDKGYLQASVSLL